MNKLSATLTMTLLLGSSLQAAALQVTDGALTPRSEATQWIAEQKSGSTHKNSITKIHSDLKSAAAAAERDGDVELFIELWQMQQSLSKESQSSPDRNQLIIAWTAHNMLKAAADVAKKANDVERVLELWQMQQSLSKEKPNVSSADRGQVITVNLALKSAADVATKAKDGERVLELWKMQRTFITESKTTPGAEEIRSWTVNQALKSAADEAQSANNAERVLKLFEMQQEFFNASNIIPTDSDELIRVWTVNQALKSAADEAQSANNAERVLKLFEMQKKFFTASNRTATDTNELIRVWTVNTTLKSAADVAKRANNGERVAELWKMQQEFLTAFKITTTSSDELIGAWTLNQALKSAADEAQRANDPKRVVKLFEMQQELSKSRLASPQLGEHVTLFKVHETFNSALNAQTDNQAIVELYEEWVAVAAKHPPQTYLGIKDPNSLRSKYEAAKKEVEKARSLVPADRRLETGAVATNELSVKALVGLYGTMLLDTSSYAKFTESFQSLYRIAALRFHSDRNPSAEAAEKFRILGDHKAWVEALTEAKFAASAK